MFHVREELCLVNADELDVEDERGAGGNDAGVSALSVSIVGRAC